MNTALDKTGSKPYRKGVGVVLVNKKNRVFVGQRINVKVPAWQMPQGGIEKGEAPLEAAMRELEEETGIRKAELIAETDDWLHYDLPTDLASSAWNGKYRGQKQKWYLMRFTGSDTDVNINTESPEFSEWSWANFHSLPEMIVEFKKGLYKQIVETFSVYIL